MKYKEKTHREEEMILPESGMVVGRPGRSYQNNKELILTHTNSYIHTYIYTDNPQKEILLQFINFNHPVFNFSKSFTLVDWARLCIPVIVNSMLRDSEKKK